MNKDRKLTQTFNSNFRYIHVGDVLSLNNSRFGDYLYLLYPNELEVKNTTRICGKGGGVSRRGVWGPLKVPSGSRAEPW